MNGDLPSEESGNVDTKEQRDEVAWVATRKALPVAEAALGEKLLRNYILHSLVHVKSSLPEPFAASHVAIELPANVESGYEQRVLAFTARVLKQC